jgi:hypothetical protein
LEGRVPKKIEDRSTPAETRPQVAYDRPEGCLLRLFWTVAGNLALFALVLSIFKQDGFSLLDGAYWVVVVALAVSRYVEITHFAGQTLDGRPGTLTDVRRYGIWLLLVATGLWISAHVV